MLSRIVRVDDFQLTLGPYQLPILGVGAKPDDVAAADCSASTLFPERVSKDVRLSFSAHSKSEFVD